MNRYNQNKMNHPEIWTKFDARMDFYLPLGVILVELDPSNYTMEKTTGSHVLDKTGLDSGKDILQPCESANMARTVIRKQ